VQLSTVGLSFALLSVVVGATATIHWRVTFSNARYEFTGIIGTLTLCFALSRFGSEVGAVLTIALVTSIWSAAIVLNVITRAQRRERLERGIAEFRQQLARTPSGLVTIQVEAAKSHADIRKNLLADAFAIRVRPRADREW
jgi:hypothetical protein